jgi:hypothetical protein
VVKRGRSRQKSALWQARGGRAQREFDRPDMEACTSARWSQMACLPLPSTHQEAEGEHRHAGAVGGDGKGVKQHEGDGAAPGRFGQPWAHIIPASASRWMRPDVWADAFVNLTAGGTPGSRRHSPGGSTAHHSAWRHSTGSGCGTPVDAAAQGPEFYQEDDGRHHKQRQKQR